VTQKNTYFKIECKGAGNRSKVVYKIVKTYNSRNTLRLRNDMRRSISKVDQNRKQRMGGKMIGLQRRFKGREDAPVNNSNISIVYEKGGKNQN